MKMIEFIKTLSAKEFATYLSSDSFPYYPCCICKYDEGPVCIKEGECTEAFKVELYEEWLNKELS